MMFCTQTRDEMLSVTELLSMYNNIPLFAIEHYLPTETTQWYNCHDLALQGEGHVLCFTDARGRFQYISGNWRVVPQQDVYKGRYNNPLTARTRRHV